MNELTIARREELTDILIEQWVDNIELDDLIEFYANAQLDYLNELSMDDFVEVANENELID
jgi:hypothetical protein